MMQNKSKVEEYVAQCRRDNKIIVIGKDYPHITQLEIDQFGLVTNYYGLLFDLWNEIVEANNFS
jgi:hypothetical protein